MAAMTSCAYAPLPEECYNIHLVESMEGAVTRTLGSQEFGSVRNTLSMASLHSD